MQDKNKYKLSNERAADKQLEQMQVLESILDAFPGQKDLDKRLNDIKAKTEKYIIKAMDTTLALKDLLLLHLQINRVIDAYNLCADKDLEFEHYPELHTALKESYISNALKLSKALNTVDSKIKYEESLIKSKKLKDTFEDFMGKYNDFDELFVDEMKAKPELIKQCYDALINEEVISEENALLKPKSNIGVWYQLLRNGNYIIRLGDNNDITALALLNKKFNTTFYDSILRATHAYSKTEKFKKLLPIKPQKIK